jgi:methyl-accepting chemotaxis protein
MKEFKLGLIAKFTLSVALALVLTTVILSFSNIQIERSRVRAEIRNKGTALARNLAYNSEYGLLSGNKESLARLAKNALEEDVAYVQILDNKGNVLVQEQKASSGATILDLEVPVVSLELVRPAEEIGLEPLAPVKAEQKESKVGLVRLGISLARVDVVVNQLIGLIWGVALLVTLAGILGLVLLSRVLLIAPLKQFVSGTKQISQGDLVYRVKIESRDEIGELADSFNIMTTELNKAQEQLVGYTKELESKVAERTQALEKSVTELQLAATELATAKTGLEKKVAERTAELQTASLSLETKIKERTTDLELAKNDLEKKVAELEEFHDLTVGRELKMIELEKETNALLAELGREPRYQ